MRLNRLIIILIVILDSGFSHAQKPVSESELIKFKQEIDNDAIKLRQKLTVLDYLSDFERQLSIDFKIDTFRIERMLQKRMEIDYSTAGIVKATYDAEAEYDKLLNKYYQWLLKKLNDSDKEYLKQSQRNWLQFRDSERKLNAEVSKDEYSGGGTMQRVIVAGEYLDLTQRRVIELYGYLIRFNE